MKDELVWADFMVRSDRAIRHFWTLVCCAFAFCWWHAAGQSRRSDPSMQLSDTPTKPTEAGKKTSSAQTLPCWPHLLRAWLTPGYWLGRCWVAFASTPLSAELAALFGALNASHGINLYLRLQQITANPIFAV